jgi:hypothetical protein
MTFLESALAAAFLALGSQDTPPSPGDAIRAREEAFRSIDGILEVTVCGANGEKHIVVRVDGRRAADAVRGEFGERIEGYRLIVLVCKPAPPGAETVLPETPAPPAPAPKPPAEPQGVEGCDLAREALRLPPRKTKHSSSARCVTMRRTVFGGSDGRDPCALLRVVGTPMGATPWFGGRSYLSGAWACEYPKHRDDCPILQGIRRQWVDSGMPPAVGTPLLMTPSGVQPLPPPPPRRRVFYGDGPWWGYCYPRYWVPCGAWRR